MIKPDKKKKKKAKEAWREYEGLIIEGCTEYINPDYSPPDKSIKEHDKTE